MLRRRIWVRLGPRTWLADNGRTYMPGAVIELDEPLGRALVKEGRATLAEPPRGTTRTEGG